MFKIFHKHYGTERFFVMIFLCLAILIGMFIYGGHIYNEGTKYVISSTSLYTGSYTWSRTSATGSVVSLIGSEDKTKAFMLLKNDKFTSFDAYDYEVFFTNNDKSEPRANDPALTIYSYGASGYVGFYFVDAKGFANQILDLIIRNDTPASEAADESMFDPYAPYDQSFRDHNQIQLFANFGASGMKVSPLFDTDQVNQITLFIEAAGTLSDGSSATGRFEELVKKADETLTKMSREWINIKAYAGGLENLGIVVPELPYSIKDDRIDKIAIDYGNEPAMFSSRMIREISAIGEGDVMLGSNSEEDGSGESSGSPEDNAAKPDPGDNAYYYLHTPVLMPGAVSFEYQNKTLYDGFITQTDFYKNLGSDDPMTAYQIYKTWYDETMADYSGSIATSVKYTSWRKRDGSYVSDKGADTGAWSVINSYVSAVNNYLKYKEDYYEYFDDILKIEYEMHEMGLSTTTNAGSADHGNIWLY